VADLLTPYYQRSADEIRVPVKSIIFAKADLYPDYKAKILTIRVNKLSTPRDNKAVMEICQTLNDYQLAFPFTNLRFFFKTEILTPTRDHEL
jgi:hypothetical protein